MPNPVLKGVVAAEGDTYGQAPAKVKTAIQFRLETFGQNALSDDESQVVKAFIAETGVPHIDNVHSEGRSPEESQVYQRVAPVRSSRKIPCYPKKCIKPSNAPVTESLTHARKV